MRYIKYIGSIVFCLLFIFNSNCAFAAQPEDFSYNGLYLGADYEQMVDKLGEPDFNTDMIHRGVMVKRYTYSAELKVYISQASGRIVEIFSKDKHYTGRDGVTYGATKAKLYQVFGKAEPKQLAGCVYYVYKHPEDSRKRLLIEMESTNYYLLSWTISCLPLDEEEALAYSEPAGDWQGTGGGKKFSYTVQTN